MSHHTEIPEQDAVRRIEVPTAGPSPIDAGCEAVCSLLLLAMIVMIGTETVARNVLGTSLQITDEVGGYLLVALTFLSMSVAESHGGFHRVEFLQMRLSPAARLVSQVIFELISLAASALVTWQLVRLVVNSWRGAYAAATPLGTPLWLPQTAMAIGMALLCLALLRTMAAKVSLLRRGVPR